MPMEIQLIQSSILTLTHGQHQLMDGGTYLDLVNTALDNIASSWVAKMIIP
jgi:hypothetical protein